ncbi:hypothetical protein BBBOND_0303560 [Babesia bigemina]|uniref:Uncharacterized protein n=1 Tax=Babesia bigemina TaxID=5866 RepID=A0A061D901_BABBI|nr:hypothetical protein BBBOND_0303560 [Babesia bigemina]CDR96452.1 hypothetical protein BBBOND_0303560 [Babesia bigemina]|eukprot:XP_012768638.1 hypothetical protein BBBOND_0303560 [Babesia bigemina]
MAPKKLTDCPENLREAIDWLIQIRHGNGKDGDGLDELAKALQQVIDEAIDKADEYLKKKVGEADKLSAADPKRSEDIKMEIVEGNEYISKLEEFKKCLCLTGDKNILAQLCSALESFLGFDNKFRGYTGKGIVYSDLDRLCDGIMAFLHGFLESVKDDESVQTYWSEADKDVEKMKGKLKQGREGLEGFLSVVELGLRDWEHVLKERSENVQKTLHDLNSNIEDEIKVISHLKTISVKEQSLYWQTTTEGFVGISDAAENFVRDLDPGLQKKIETSITVVKEAVKRLQNAAQVRGYAKAVETLQNAFDKLPKQVEYFITANVKHTIHEHEKGVTELIEKVKGDIDAIREAFLNEHLKAAQGDLKNAVNCAKNSALTLGGLRNETIKTAIRAIENRLKDKANTVVDKDILADLKTATVQKHIGTIILSLTSTVDRSVTDGIRDLETSIGQPGNVFRNQHDSNLQKLVEEARRNLETALECTRKNAAFLGGIRNEKVKTAIETIQVKMESVHSHVNSMTDLTNLKSNFMNSEGITNITQALSISAADSVKSGLLNLSESIEGPDVAFAYHKDALQSVAEQAQKSLANIIAKVQDCLLVHGGLNNSKVKQAIDAIQNQLDRVDRDNVDTMAMLKDVERTTIQEHTQVIEKALNKHGQAEHITKDLKNLNAAFNSTDKVFTDYKNSLDKLASQTQEDLLAALVHADSYLLCTDFGLRKKIVDALQPVAASKQRTSQAKQLADDVVASLQKVKDISITFKGRIQPHFDKLEHITSGGIQHRISSLKEDADSIAWIHSYISSLLSHTFKEANEENIKADQAYKQKVQAALHSIKGHIVNLKKNAENNKLDGFLRDYEHHFSSIQLAVTDHSVYDDDKKAREKYFANLMQLFNDTISTLSAAYKNAFKSAAKTYLSGAISEIKKRVNKAESAYQSEITKLSARIMAQVEDLKTIAEQDRLASVISAISTPFEEIAAATDTKSVFSEDRTYRTQYFENLKSVIENIIKSLEIAYQKAYQSSAKSYLIGAIKAIQNKIQRTEEVYEASVRGNISSIRELIGGITEEKFTKRDTRKKLELSFEEPFRQLQQNVTLNSAFKTDTALRIQCFNDLKDLIMHNVKNLSTAYEKAYQNSAMNYLQNAIRSIKEKVGEAEQKYADAIELEVTKAENKIAGLKASMFKEKGQRGKLLTLFDQDFTTLFKAVKENSAFNDDYVARMSCFEQLQNLIKDTVETLVNAYELFDDCSTKAEYYLGKAFEDSESKNENLRSTIKDKVRNAFEQIISGVYAMCAKQKEADLISLKERVQEHKQNIRSIIVNDLNKGIKGALLLLKIWIEKKVNGLKTSPDMKTLAKTFKHLYNHLHKYVKFQHDGLEVEDDEEEVESEDDEDDLRIKNQHNTQGVHLVHNQIEISNKPYGPRKVTHMPRIPRKSIQNPSGRAGMSHNTDSTGQRSSSTQTTKNPIIDYFGTLHIHTLQLFSVLCEGRFSHKSAYRCTEFLKVLRTMHPSKFAGQSSSLLDALKSGLQYLMKEISYAYVNAYDGASYGFEWDDPSKSKFTEDAMNCAKIGITIIDALFHDLHGLFYNCSRDYKYNPIKGADNKYDFRSYIENHGYVVENLLQDQKGSRVKDILKKAFSGKNEFQSSQETNNTFFVYLENVKTPKGILGKLFSHLVEYYNVCHLRNPVPPEHPCTIFEMLVWLCGLEHNIVYSKLQICIRRLYDPGNNHQFALAQRDTISYYIYNSSTYSRKLLTAIVGTGDASTTYYACDFSNNSLNFHYPATGEECLHMLLDILRRLFPVLRFLHTQCKISAVHYGWADCQYGKSAQPCNWQCNDHSTDKFDCQSQSPLMSYLSDCLLGYLPHQLRSIGCQPKCFTCPTSQNGMPCLTPLGFREFSGSARTGSDLSGIIGEFFVNVDITSLFCLVPRPPTTLPEHFGFVSSLVNKFHGSNKANTNVIKTNFETSIKKLSMKLYGNTSAFTDAFSDAYGSADTVQHSKCVYHHLMHLSTRGICMHNNLSSAPYLFSLYTDYYRHHAPKHSDLYLSWAVYLPWQFHCYLESLLKDFQDIFCRDWGCRVCLNSNNCKRGQHGFLNPSSIGFGCQCPSIVSCKGVLPTLYRYGLTYDDAEELNSKKKTCFDFRTQLSNVLHSEYFSKLFDECDKFLWEIRQPFSYLLLALWLLSLLYLIHIMVIRLDLLHIKSHLHSPSSHRIAAQSLLAAARVKALNKVLYLQP